MVNTTKFEAQAIYETSSILSEDAPECERPVLRCKECSLHILPTEKDALFTCFLKSNNETVFSIHLSAGRCDVARMGTHSVHLSTSQTDGSSFSSMLIKFRDQIARDAFYGLLNKINKSDEAMRESNKSLFNSRTDDASASQYFQFYGYLSQQQNMMQDYIRTSTYQRAIHDNYTRIMGKVVLDVGAGSGILSFFATQAGAAKVYAVEASSVAVQAEELVRSNMLQDKIQVICGKIEEINLPEKVDVIISEPMGYLLFNERMLETFLHAKKWLKPGGQMLPSFASLYMAPFTDEALYLEQVSKSNFWLQTSFYGMDLSALKDEASAEYFRQPIVDTFDPRICLCKPFKYDVDFMAAQESDLYEMVIDADFGSVLFGGIVHGVAFWFDVAFPGAKDDDPPIWLSTSPSQPLTHWYQVRCLLSHPIMVQATQELTGKFVLRSNTRQSYDIDMEIQIKGKSIVSRNTLDLKNPYFRYTGQAPTIPPGQAQVESPTDAYFNNSYGNATTGSNSNYCDPANNNNRTTASLLSPMAGSFPNGGGGDNTANSRQYPVMGTSSDSTNCNINNSYSTTDVEHCICPTTTATANDRNSPFDSDFEKFYQSYSPRQQSNHQEKMSQ